MTFVDGITHRSDDSYFDNEIKLRDSPSKTAKPTEEFKKQVKQRNKRKKQMVRSLEKYKKIVMLPDDELESNEVVRPFLILQPALQ